MRAINRLDSNTIWAVRVLESAGRGLLTDLRESDSQAAWLGLNTVTRAMFHLLREDQPCLDRSTSRFSGLLPAILLSPGGRTIGLIA